MAFRPVTVVRANAGDAQESSWRIEHAIMEGDVRVIEEYGGLQAVKRSVALEKRARRQT